MDNGMNRVLVVDDDEMLVQMVELALKMRGFEVLSAFSGAEALDRLREGGRPDLVLLDIMMPGFDGWETLRRIRADDSLSSVRVIVFSAKPVTPDRLAMKDELGFEEFMSKPFGLEDLYSSVSRALEF